MPSSVAEIDIWNLALDLLVEAPVSSTDEDSDVALWFKRNYAHVRDAELRRFPWNFALERVELAKSTTAPAWGWSNKYELPAECLRLLKLRQGGLINGALIPYELEQSCILTNAGPPLRIRYIKRITPTGHYDPLFVELLSTSLALRASHWMTSKSSFSQRLEQRYEKVAADARRSDAIEQFQEDLDQSDVISVRG